MARRNGSLEPLLEAAHIRSHLPARLRANDQRDQELADPVPAEVEVDCDACAPALIEGIDRDVDLRSNRSVDPTHTPCAGRVDMGDLRRDRTLGESDTPSHLTPRPDGSRRVVIHVPGDDARLPLLEASGVG